MLRRHGTRGCSRGEFGDKIIVQFTIGALTTDGLALTSVKAVELQVAVGKSAQNAAHTSDLAGPVASRFPSERLGGKAGDPDGAATGRKGKASDWSNSVTLAVGPPLATPANLESRFKTQKACG